MAGSKRERDLHRAKLARQQQEEAEAATRRKRLLTIGGGVVGVVAVIALVAGIAIAGGGSDGTKAADATPTSNTGTASAAPSSAADISKVKCTPPSAAKPSQKQYTDADRSVVTLQPNATDYTETMTTNCGKIAFALDFKGAPETAKSMLFLSDRANFYDNISCHRLTTSGIYVLQCGDPKGDGSGGPGYTIPEENFPAGDPNGTVTYKRGTVAMANTGAAKSTGSQFFIVYKDSQLAPKYTVAGNVTEGLNIVDYVASKGVQGGGADGAPNQPLKINKMVASLSVPQGGGS